MDREMELRCALAKTLGMLESIVQSPEWDAENVRGIIKRIVPVIYDAMPDLKKPEAR